MDVFQTLPLLKLLKPLVSRIEPSILNVMYSFYFIIKDVWALYLIYVHFSISLNKRYFIQACISTSKAATQGLNHIS